jgi:hypothetical protein
MFEIELIYSDLKTKPKTLFVSEQTNIYFIKKKTGNDENNIELIYNGHILEDDFKLLDYQIKNTTNLYVVNIDNSKPKEIKENIQIDLLDTFINILNSFNFQYENELNILNNMGFVNRNRNISLLTLYQGNIETVISIILDEMNA